ncbi:hypothetical protein ABKN59_011111 [Abortiporus biennis]
MTILRLRRYGGVFDGPTRTYSNGLRVELNALTICVPLKFDELVGRVKLIIPPPQPGTRNDIGVQSVFFTPLIQGLSSFVESVENKEMKSFFEWVGAALSWSPDDISNHSIARPSFRSLWTSILFGTSLAHMIQSTKTGGDYYSCKSYRHSDPTIEGSIANDERFPFLATKKPYGCSPAPTTRASCSPSNPC